MTDELDLHDEAAETADQTLSDLKELAAESISRRAARIHSEIYSMIEACSLLGSINWNALRGGGVKNPETIDHALKMHHFACAAEAVGYTAIESLGMFTDERCGHDLDQCLESALENMSEEWIHKYFVGYYRNDEARDENVARLNAILSKAKPPKGPKSQKQEED